MMRYLAVAGLLWLPALNLAAAQPDDYAFGAAIDVRAGDALYVVDLSEQVYQNVARDDLSDVAVFDANGGVPPFMLRRQTAASGKSLLTEVPLFPVRSHAGGKIDSSSMRVVRDTTGRLVEIAGNVEPRRDAVVSAYIIDASQLTDRVTGLLFDWPSGSLADTVMVQVTLEASDDLKTWRYAGNGVLSRLNFAGRTLEQRRIDPETAAKYYRLSWSNLPQALDIARVRAELAPKTIPPTLLWRKIVPVKVGKGYEFDAGGPFPAERVRISLDGANAVVATRLYSRSRPNADWRLRYDGPIYDLRVNGLRFDHSELTLQDGGARYWRIELREESASAPALELGWLPHQVILIARGKPPFQLAFGRAAKGADDLEAAAIIANLLEQKVAATPVKLGSPHELGGAARLRPEYTLPWRKWLVWLALALGVAVLAWMATRLLRDLGAEAKAPQKEKEDRAAG